MNERIISKAVAMLRFPLMVGIVCIHTDLRIACPETGMLPWFGPFIHVFKNDICFPVLDIFFFIAGFYFFRECRFDKPLYVSKLVKRFKSLLVPYILWNGMTFAAICLCQAFTGFMPLLRKAIVDFHWYDYLLVFWDKQWVTGIPTDFHGPLMMQFWFVQCLLVCVVFSPLLWMGLRRLRWLFPVLLGVLLAIYPIREYAGVRMDAFFFFTLGAYFRLHHRLCRVLEHPKAMALCWLVSWAVMQLVPVLSVLYCIVYTLLVLSIAVNIQGLNMKDKESSNALGSQSRDSSFSILHSSFIKDSSFFIFAFHAFISQAFFNMYARLSIPWNDPLAFLVFVATVVMNVSICLLTYGMMKKYMPRFLALLMGGR